MKSTAIKISIVLLVVCCLAALGFVTPPDRVVPFVYGNQMDSIERKRIETKWVLKKYEITGLSGETREWLTRYHGEAPGQQVFYSLVDWGLANPESFIALTEGIDPTERKRLVDRLATGIIDNLNEEEFANVFSQSDASIVKEIRESIKERKQP